MRGLKDGVPTVDKKFIDCIARTVKPYDDFEKYLELAENPDFRFVVSNTTEAGIAYNETKNITYTIKFNGNGSTSGTMSSMKMFLQRTTAPLQSWLEDLFSMNFRHQWWKGER